MKKMERSKILTIQNKKRNGEIELLRFIFAVIVFSYHFEYAGFIFKSGYLAVDFFFMLSGYFMMRHIESDSEHNYSMRSLFIYIRSRFVRLFFTYFFVCFFSYFIRCFVLKEISIRTLFDKGIWEFLMLQSFGFSFTTTVLWYVSALLVSSFIIYFLYICQNKKFLPIVFFLALCLLAFLYQKNQRLSSLDNHLIVSDGLLRGFAEMSLGCILYKITQCITVKSRSIFIILSITKYALLVAFLFLMTREPGIKDYSCIVLIFGYLLLLFICQSTTSNVFNNKFFYFLGSISYDFYLNQVLIIYLARLLPANMLRENPMITFFAFIIIDIALSIITNYFSKMFSKRIKGFLVERCNEL